MPWTPSIDVLLTCQWVYHLYKKNFREEVVWSQWSLPVQK
jgi:hypothetical protein